MSAYYNEIDEYAARWLRNLIAAGHIAPGDVDTRSIEDVRPDDLFGYTQCHFFAGIGGWSAALRMAQWDDAHPVWTGSCPCQPFSVAGAGFGVLDQRHLWPSWYWLIRQRRPPVVFGEQVDAAVKHGWLDLVQADMEGIGYAFAAADIPAAGVGAPHIRQRLWFVADAGIEGLSAREFETVRGQRGWEERRAIEQSCCASGGVADAECWTAEPERHNVGSPAGETQGRAQERQRVRVKPGAGSDACERPRPLDNPWRNADWLGCRDGKWRPVEPGTFPLAHGVPGRVGRLRAYGNAIVPQVAAEVIRAYMECRP